MLITAPQDGYKTEESMFCPIAFQHLTITAPNSWRADEPVGSSLLPPSAAGGALLPLPAQASPRAPQAAAPARAGRRRHYLPVG